LVGKLKERDYLKYGGVDGKATLKFDVKGKGCENMDWIQVRSSRPYVGS
jgi:hypothetical protein